METIDPRQYIAPSVSDAARARLETLRAMLAGMPPIKLPETLEEYDAAAQRGFAAAEFLGRAAIDALAPVVVERSLGGVAVLDVVPRDYADDGTAIVYIHGGGFVQGSARSSLLMSSLVASTSGRRVISVDYTLAPRGTVYTILDEVAAVWTALLAERPATALGMMGDSAGGNIAAATTLLLRDRGLPMPAALVLLSPGVDATGGGDTNVTLEYVDYLTRKTGAANIAAYLGGADPLDPLASPVRGDFAKGYPPVLLQCGTRELLLSDSVRLHRALRAAGRISRLDLYEGMPHVFQSLFAETPEGIAAWSEMTAFWAEFVQPRP